MLVVGPYRAMPSGSTTRLQAGKGRTSCRSRCPAGRFQRGIQIQRTRSAIDGADRALRFYRDVFRARIADSVEIEGAVVHAELDFGHGRLQIGEPSALSGLVATPSDEPVCYSIGLYCPNVDAVTERATAAGATLLEPPTTFVSGDRFASIRDPFGVRWAVMTRVEDLSEEESAARVAAWAKEQAGGEK